MQNPVTSIGKMGSRSTWLWGMPFLAAKAVPPFFPGSSQSNKIDNFKLKNLS
jgi:hypothetical protein